MMQNLHLLSQKEHTDIPDITFPINVFHLHRGYHQVIPPHWHEHFEWIAVLQGSFRVQVDTQFEDVKEGDAIFVNTQQLHSAFPTEDNSELYAVVFNEALLRNHSLDSIEAKYIQPLMNQELHLPSFFFENLEGINPIHSAIVSIVEHYREKGMGYELFIKSSIFAALGHAFQNAVNPRKDAKHVKQQAVIQPLIIHLIEHYRKPISIAQAAQMCCVSPNYFCSIFKKATGKTLLQYVNLLRIHEAEQLLQTQLYSIEEVALKVGYHNSTYFGRIFKKYKNQTAKEYMDGQ